MPSTSTSVAVLPVTLRGRLGALWLHLSHFPWRNTAQTLHERFREDRLGLTASSLTFTSTIALVPFFTVALAIFTAFPMFATLQDVLQKWLIESLIPDNIARQVLGYLNQFAGKASKLGTVGIAALLATALALNLTIDRTLNAIWRVRRPRPLGQRLLIYWAGMTLGPLLLAASLAITSYVVSASSGAVGVMPGGVRYLLGSIEFALVAAAMAALFHYVPNTVVHWGHAWTGGIFVAAGIELAKKLLTLYLSGVGTYSMVYGAFATVPILLIWIYTVWVIVLLGAVIAAYLPSLLSGTLRRRAGPGWDFQLALEVVQELERVRLTPDRGLSISALGRELQVGVLALEPVLDTLKDLDWSAELAEELPDGEARHVLLVDPDRTTLQPLLQALLLAPTDANRNLWNNGRWSSLLLRDAL